MTTYKKILSKAKECKTNVKKEYKLGVSKKYCYYFAKAILKPKTDIAKIDFEKEATPQATHISRQISKNDYLDLAKRLTTYVEKHHQLPNYVAYKDYKVKIKLLTYVFAKILLHYHKDGKLPDKVTINSKIFTKPTETGNAVYDYACKKYGKTFKTLDDILEYVAHNFKYEFYYDDRKSNKEVTDSKAGNCTDLLQWLTNMVEPIGYQWKCIHVQCRQSGTGHVFGKFKHSKNTGNEWVIRDIACCADNGSVSCVWCRDGYVLAENPSWWVSNRQR